MIFDNAQRGVDTITTGQVAVGTSATLIAAAAPGARSSITITNTAATAVYLGGSGVTTATGLLLPATIGASVTLNFSGALYGVVTTGSVTVSYAALA